MGTDMKKSANSNSKQLCSLLMSDEEHMLICLSPSPLVTNVKHQ